MHKLHLWKTNLQFRVRQKLENFVDSFYSTFIDRILKNFFFRRRQVAIAVVDKPVMKGHCAMRNVLDSGVYRYFGLSQWSP